jgi:hypothetical protein
MVRTRIGLLAAFIALGLSAGACDKGGGQGAASAVAGLTGDVAMLPADSELVIGLNFAQLQQSALWKQFAPAIMARASAGLNDFKTACGFDPMEAVKSVSAGIKGFGNKAPDGVVVIHGLDKGKVMGCLDKAKEEVAKKGGEVVVEGEVFTIRGKHGATVWTFTNADTLVGSIGTAASKATLQAATAGKGLGASATFVDIYKKINTKESLWLLVNGNASFMAEAAGQLGMKPKAVFGSVNVTDGLALDMRIRVATKEEADKVVKLGQSQLGNPQVKSMFDKLDISAEGTDVRMSVAMSQQKLTALMGLFGGALSNMLGGGAAMGGGMGGGMGGP